MTELILAGLDAQNPLAFLAALGTLRVASETPWGHHPRLSWRRQERWRPVLHLAGHLDRAGFVEALAATLARCGTEPFDFEGAKDLKILPCRFRQLALAAVGRAGVGMRREVDLHAALASDADENDDGHAADTAFRTMRGAGHQHFLETIRRIMSQTNPEHLDRALFERWRYDDPLRNLSLRFDPTDDQRHALRWDDPSDSKTRGQRGSVLGANRLAIEGLAFFPVAPVGRRVATTGFSGRGSLDTAFTWPTWEPAVTAPVVRSLVALEGLQHTPPDADLRQHGIVEVFRSRRITVGQYRNFSPAEAL